MLVYYISSHGYGHAVRSCEVIRQLPADIPVVIKSAVPEGFLREELEGFAFEYIHAEYDCGVLGPDSSHADLELTFARATQLEAHNSARLGEETAWLKETGARIVVADIVPFGLRAAHAAELPSILIANFTWSAIYQDLLVHLAVNGNLLRRGEEIINQLQTDFDAGTLLLETEFAIPIQACARRERIGLISRRGVNRRNDLVKLMGLDPAKPIYLIYLGRDGLEGIDWAKLPQVQGQFIAYSVPPGAESFIHSLPPYTIHHADAAASVDAVIAKPGYGLCAECMAAGTPLLYVPRPHFSESEAIAKVLARWGGALELDIPAFRGVQWAQPLERLRALKPDPDKVDLRGASEAAEHIMRLHGQI